MDVINNHTRMTGVNQDGGRSVRFCGRLGLKSWREFAYARLGGLAGRVHHMEGTAAGEGSGGECSRCLQGRMESEDRESWEAGKSLDHQPEE